LGFGIVSSSNGEQALLEVEARRIDAVLLDINMPGIGGIETCRRIRKKAPLLPIPMLTVRARKKKNRMQEWLCPAPDTEGIRDIALLDEPSRQRNRTCGPSAEASFTNAFNLANFAPPAMNVTSPSFGVLRSVLPQGNGGNRTGQLESRLDF